jgi:hypothetical protein
LPWPSGEIEESIKTGKTPRMIADEIIGRSQGK